MKPGDTDLKAVQQEIYRTRVPASHKTCPLKAKVVDKLVRRQAQINPRKPK